MSLYENLLNNVQIRYEDRVAYGITDVQSALQTLNQAHQVLFHGTTTDISYGDTLHLRDGRAFATNHAGIAILKGLFLNDSKYTTNLGYPLNLNRFPLALEIENGLPGVEVEWGYVYVITENEKFHFDQKTNWQFITHDSTVRVLGRIEVRRPDFRHPVNYVNRPEKLFIRNGG